MKKRHSIKSFLILLLLFSIGFYLNSDLFLSNKVWKYSHGNHLGDVIKTKEIDNSYFSIGSHLIIFSDKSISNVGIYSLKSF